jgi:hypothetical protein
MRKLFLAAILAASLMGCNPHHPLPIVQCDPIGVDIIHPDFYQKHKLANVEKYYTCMENEVRTEAYNEYAHMNALQVVGLGMQGVNPAAAETQRGEKAAEALEYQKNLWRQVLKKEKKPGAAYEAWIRYGQNERNINATANAARAANRAADAAAAAQQQQSRTNFQLQQMQQQQFMQNSINQGLR